MPGNRGRSNGRSNGRSRSSRPGIQALLSRKLRSMGVTQQTWILQRMRSSDPPPYNIDANYQRKIRFSIPTSEDNEFTITLKMIFDNVFTARGTYTPFRALSVHYLTVYGEASAGSVIDVLPLPATTLAGINAGRNWSDLGVQGSRRPCVKLFLPPHCRAWIPASSEAAEIVRISHNTAIIVDIVIEMTNSVTFPFTRDGSQFFPPSRLIPSNTEPMDWELTPPEPAASFPAYLRALSENQEEISSDIDMEDFSATFSRVLDPEELSELFAPLQVNATTQ
jgi:hypothetical protein